jgi:hypothetical protein
MAVSEEWVETAVGNAKVVNTTILPKSPRSRATLAAALAMALTALLAGPALGQPWSTYGGDPGRSGHQPGSSAVTSIRALYALTGPDAQGIVTSVVTTGGPPSAQLVVYGTADGKVHLRRLVDGHAIGPPEGTDVSNRPDPFGSNKGTGFASTSSAAELGQLYVTHNGPGGVYMAQFDEASGALVQRTLVAPAYSIRSSPLLSPPLNAAGDRALLFVALQDRPEQDKATGAQPTVSGMGADIDGRKLFKVTVTQAGTREAKVGPITDAGGLKANPDASPTLAYLSSNNGAVEPYVALGTSTGRVLTYSVGVLAPGPHHSTGGENDRAMTPAVPITPSGLPPGADGSGMDRASHLFVASTDGNLTTLHRVTRPNAQPRFAVADSAKLPGAASVALATSQMSLPDRPAPGLVYVATDKNLYALDADSLAVAARFSPVDLPPGAGFSQTVPSVTSNMLFLARDNGEQLVLDARTLQPVSDKVFRQQDGNGGAKASFGQPGLSHHRQVIFASDRGLFPYGLN